MDADVRDPQIVAVVAAEELRHGRAVREAERDHGLVRADGAAGLFDSTGAAGRVSCVAAADGVEYACEDHQGLLYVWRGEPSTADVAMLPTHPTPEATHTVETILDYGCDWKYIVENNLDTPHLYWLHDVRAVEFEPTRPSLCQLEPLLAAATCDFG